MLTGQHSAGASRRRCELPTGRGAAHNPRRPRACHKEALPQAPEEGVVIRVHQVRRSERFQNERALRCATLHPGSQKKKEPAR
ncbi:hypothetical protein NDU88_003809 [Pleurodeles waltl]|uniref:Uncharacterized protein n=1 Tax=Pleurodeles waltl TaxID=8319 RepID=A0AAV7QFX7_PLEWA|nr:hypothetical protein NDU88_003809 [Pleurodeles waltl]